MITYEEYIKGYNFPFKPGDKVTLKGTRETVTIEFVRKSFIGLDVYYSFNGGTIDGPVGHKSILPLMTNEERIRFCLENPCTTVEVEHDDALNKYAIVVTSRDHFQLATFNTEQQALDYVSQNNLIVRTHWLEGVKP